MSNDGHAAELRIGLVKRLRARSGEMDGVIFEQLHRGADQAGNRDIEYRAGLRAAVSAVVDHGIMAIEHGDEWSGPIPSAAVLQAHRAAQHGVSLETVLLGYATVHRHFCGFLLAEAEQLQGQVLRYILDIQGALLTRLMAAVSCEYRGEVKRAQRTSEHRRVERMQKLLANEAIDTAAFDYEFADAWHVGMIAIGSGARAVLQSLAARSGCQLLFALHGQETVWAWLGGESSLVVADALSRLPAPAVAGILLALGEPGRGLPGWRLTHYQAQAALPVAMHRLGGVTRYAEEMLLAAVLQNDMLAKSLEDVYLAPLAGHRTGETVLVDTLRAYFVAQRSVAGTAASLGLERHTVRRRLRAIEIRLGRLLHTCDAELQLALGLCDLRAGAGKQ